MSSYMKFHIFSITFYAMKWRPTRYKMAPHKLYNGAQLRLTDAFCKNTSHFDLLTVPALSSVVFRKRHRENKETISIVKATINNLPVFWLIVFRFVREAKIAPRIASTAENKLH